LIIPGVIPPTSRWSSSGGCWTWRGAEATAQPARGAPFVKLEDSSDDNLYWPTPPRFSDAGQGSSRWNPGQSSQQAPPQDDGGDSSDDYTRFYRHFSM
jgi:hypothetical protein